MSATPDEEEIARIRAQRDGRRPSQVTRLSNGYTSQRRSGVSAESVDPNAEKSHGRIVHEKSDDEKARIRKACSTNLLFRDLDQELLTDVVDAMFEKEVKAGENVIVQGEPGDFYYIIKEGEFQISVNGNPVVTIGPGKSFGELALMYFAPRAATCTALSPATLWALDRMTFRRTLMEKTNAKRKEYEQFLHEVPILADLDVGERARMADVLTPQQHADGEVIIRQGDEGDMFFIVVEGTASVRQSRDGGPEIELVRLQKGNYFGEIALLLEEPRAASVVAVKHCTTVGIDRATFVRLLGPITNILHRNLENYQTYEQRLASMGKSMDDADVGTATPRSDTPRSDVGSPVAEPAPFEMPPSPLGK